MGVGTSRGGRAALLLALLLVGGCGGCGDRLDLDASKETLVKLPGGWRRGTVAVADDGRTVAFVEDVDGGARVVAGGAPGRRFAQVTNPQFAPKTHRLGYWATDSTQPPAEVGLVIDGQVIPTEANQPGTLVWSPDGTRWGAAVGLAEEVVDGVPHRRPTVILVDGRDMGRWIDTTPPAFSPDGRHVAWLAQIDDGRIAVVVDGVAREPFAKPEGRVSPGMTFKNVGPTLAPQHVLRWLADGTLLLLAPDRDGWTLSRDGTVLGVWRHVEWQTAGPIHLAFGDEFANAARIASIAVAVAAKAPVVAYWERLEGEKPQWRVMRDGKPVDDVICSRYWETQPPPTLSSDGRHIAYACAGPDAMQRPDVVVVVDGVRHGPYRNVYGIAVAEDASHGAWAATLDPEPSPTWHFFIDGKALRGDWAEAWRPRLDDPGEHLAWEAAPARGRPALGIDGVSVSRFDGIFWGPVFTEPRRVGWVVRRGRRLVRLDLTY
ncbi:MAG: hypothetical protein KIT14_02870 [bacterium]|nr:hypothetical protein [bacterium]